MAEERRAGADLVRATKPFSDEDPARTWALMWQTLFVFAVFEAGALVAPLYLAIPSAIVAGLVWVRIFIFYHDYLHGAIFRKSPAGAALMHVYGILTLSPASVWRQTHDYHHQNNAKMLGAAIGSYPTVTVGIWKTLKPSQRFWYKFARNPLTMIFGYFTVFMAGMCIAAFVREPKVHWEGPLALLIHAALLALVGSTLGVTSALVGIVLVLMVSCAAGSYLFYAQHNFPACELRGRDKWTYHHAALRASSMFDMPAIMHWFTGNIGYHHVHHLNHNIPFYRLPEAMAGMPELQDPGRTSWAPSDVMACLRLALWDPERNRLVSWDEANV
jgi:acyl-lipid omega-6 desaturase (Delta-12 desaturase)